MHIFGVDKLNSLYLSIFDDICYRRLLIHACGVNCNDMALSESIMACVARELSQELFTVSLGAIVFQNNDNKMEAENNANR